MRFLFTEGVKDSFAIFRLNLNFFTQAWKILFVSGWEESSMTK